MAKFRTWVDTSEAPVVTADYHGRYISIVFPCTEIKLSLKEASELAEKLVKEGEKLVEYAKPFART